MTGARRRTMRIVRASILALCLGCSGGVSLKALLVAPGSGTLRSGGTLQLSATLVKSDGSSQDITSTAVWTSSDPAKATVSAAGLVSAAGAGSVTITATDGKLKASAAITVSAAGLKAIAIVAPRKTVPRGFSELLSATGVFDDGKTQDLTGAATWGTSDAALASADKGNFTAKSAGSVTVTAASGGVTGSLAVTVSNAALSAVAVSPASPGVAAGLSLPLSATGSFDDASTLDLTTQVTWSSASSAVAAVSSAGVVTGKTAGGPVAVTATHSASGKSGSASVTVTAPQLTSLSISGVSGDLAVGDALQLMATGAYSDGSTQDLTATVSWSSSATSVATVTAGLVSAAGLGDVEIDAAGPGGHSASLVLHVRAAELLRLAAAPASVTLASGSSYQLQANGFFTDATQSDVTASAVWTSDTPAAVAMGSAPGLIQALHVGNATVTAKKGGLAASVSVTVSAGALVSIAVTPGNATLPSNVSQQYSATGLFADGSSADLTAQVTWSTNCGNYASITSPGGLLTVADYPDSCTVSAHDPASNLDGSTGVSLVAVKVVSLHVDPQSATLPLGATLKLTGFALLSDGSEQDYTYGGSDTWTSDDATTVSVGNGGSAGIVKALKKGGPVAIHFGDGTLDAHCPITVTDPVLVALTVAPSAATIPAGTTLQLTALGAFTDGSSKDFTSAATWSGSDSHISVDATGLAHALAAGGPVTITATLPGGLSASTALTAAAPALKRIVISPPHPALLQSSTLQLEAVGIYSDGSAAPLSGLNWSAGNSVASVDSSSGLLTASALAGIVDVTAKDESSGISGSVTASVSFTGTPRLTGTPIFSTSPAQAGGTVTVTLPITSNVKSAGVTLQDGNSNTFGSGSVSDDGHGSVLGKTSVDVVVFLSCFPSAKVYANVSLGAPSGSGSNYYFHDGDLYYGSQTYYDGSSYTYFGPGYFPVVTASGSVGPPPDTICHFPFMVGSPTVLANPVVGGTLPSVTLTVSPDTTTVAVRLTGNTGTTVGYGALNISGTHDAPFEITVPMSRSSCYATDTSVHADADLHDFPSDTTKQYHSYYSLDPNASGNYGLRQQDAIGEGPETPTSIAISPVGWTPVTSCSYIPTMTASPTLDSATVAPGAVVKVTIPKAASAVTVCAIFFSYPDLSNEMAANCAYDYSGKTSIEVDVTTDPSAPAGQYVVATQLLLLDGEAGSDYFYGSSISSQNYAVRLTDDFSQSIAPSDSGVAMTFLTVSAP